MVQSKKTQRNAESILIVPGAGIEPARIAPLVFETSASTDSAIRAGVLCPKTGTRRIDLLVKDCKGIGNFGNCKINDIPWTENPIELTKVELKTFYNSEYHGTLDGNISESVQGVLGQVCPLRYARPGVFAQVCPLRCVRPRCVQTQSILQLSSPLPEGV